jgi:hypothetical protein
MPAWCRYEIIRRSTQVHMSFRICLLGPTPEFRKAPDHVPGFLVTLLGPRNDQPKIIANQKGLTR